MAKDITIAKFDYTICSKEEKGKLIYYEAQLNKIRKKVVESAIRTGEMLCGVRDVLSYHKTGVFLEWLKTREFSQRSAYHFMDAYEAFGMNVATVATFDPSALYVLASNEPAKKEALKLAAKGEVITQKKAKEIVAQCKPDPVEAPPADNASETVDVTQDAATAVWVEQASTPTTASATVKLPATARSKAVKTAEALLRAVDDLHEANPNKPAHRDLISIVQQALSILKDW